MVNNVDVVIGAGGKCGQLCVERLLENGGLVRAVGRDVEKLKAALGEREKLSFAAADVSKPETLKECLVNARGVIYAASGKGYFSAAEVDNKGVARVAAAAKAAGAKRVVLISSCLVTTKHRFNPIRLLLNNMRYGLMDEKLAGEATLRASGMPFTIVRPGGLTNVEGGKAVLSYSQGDLPARAPGMVSRADVASICVAALSASAAKDTTFEIMSKPEEVVPPNQLDTYFEGLVTAVHDTRK